MLLDLWPTFVDTTKQGGATRYQGLYDADALRDELEREDEELVMILAAIGSPT